MNAKSNGVKRTLLIFGDSWNFGFKKSKGSANEKCLKLLGPVSNFESDRAANNLPGVNPKLNFGGGQNNSKHFFCYVPRM